MSGAGTREPGPSTLRHDAFVSYSRRDKAFATKLGTALRGYRPPKDLGLAPRSLDVFRDEDDFTGAEYHRAVREHLSSSRRLILVCSPHSRRSEYVGGEIRLFTEIRGADNIIPLLIAGVPNNEAKEGQEDQMAFPAALCDALEMPLAIDYRAFDPRKDRVDKGGLRAPWFSLLAGLYGISRSEIEQREKVREMRRRRVAQGIVGAVMAVLLTATAVSVYFWRQAVEQRTVAVARQLAAQAELTRNQAPTLIERSVLLAVESMRRRPTLEADLVLRPQLALLPRPRKRFSLGGEPYLIAFSPDRRLVAAATTSRFGIWELATSRPMPSLAALPPLATVEFSPDGEHLATGSGSADPSRPRNYVAQIWHLGSGREVARLPHGAPVKNLAFSADGRYLATAAEKDVAIWEVSTGKAVAAFPHEAFVLEVALSPDGERLFTGTNAEVNRIWNVRTEEPIAGAQLHPGMYSVAFSPDWERIATADDDGITVRDTVTHNELMRIPERGASHPAFASNGAWILAAGRDGSTIVWDAETADELARLPSVEEVRGLAISPDRAYVATYGGGDLTVILEVPGEEVTRVPHPNVISAEFSADGRQLATVDLFGGVRLWDTTEGREASRLRHDSTVVSVAYTPDGRHLVTNSHDRSARVWEARSEREVARIDSEYGVRDLAVSPLDGKYLAVAVDRGTRLHETLTGRTVATLEGVVGCVFSPDGKYLATSGLGNVARVWEVPSGRELEIARLPLGDGIASLAFSPDARHLAAATINSSLAVVWDRTTGREVARMQVEGGFDQLAFSPDGRYLAAAASQVEGGVVLVWETLTGREVHRMVHEGVALVAFGPDGRLLATGGLGTDARVWDASTGEGVSRLPHGGAITAMVFGSDGARLMTGSIDGAARVWDPLTGREVARLQPRSAVLGVAVAPDGRHVATASEDGYVRTWFLRPDDLVAEACARVTRNLTREEWSQFLGEEPYVATCPNLPSEGNGRAAASPP